MYARLSLLVNVYTKMSTGRRSRRLQTGRSTGRQIMNQSVSPAVYDRKTRTNMWKNGREWVPAEPVKKIDTEKALGKAGSGHHIPVANHAYGRK